MAATRPAAPTQPFYALTQHWSAKNFRKGFAITGDEYNTVFAALAEELRNAGVLGSAVNTKRARDGVQAAIDAVYTRHSNLLRHPPVEWRETWLKGMAQHINRKENNARAPGSMSDPEGLTQSATPRLLSDIPLYAETEDSRTSLCGLSDVLKDGIIAGAFEATPMLASLDLEKWKEIIVEDCNLGTAEYRIMYNYGNIEITNERKWRATMKEMHLRGANRFNFEIISPDIGQDFVRVAEQLI